MIRNNTAWSFLLLGPTTALAANIAPYILPTRTCWCCTNAPAEFDLGRQHSTSRWGH